jgi:hypothetical protein
MMTRSLAHCYRGRVEAKEGFGCSANELGVGIHRLPWNVFDDVGLQKNRFSPDVQIEEPESIVDELIEFVRVLLDVQNRDT